MRTRLTTFIRSGRATIAAFTSSCERCSSVCTAECRHVSERERVRFSPNRAELFR